MGPRKLCAHSQHTPSKEKQTTLSGMVSSQGVYAALFSHQFSGPERQTFAGNNGSSRVSGPACQSVVTPLCHQEAGAPQGQGTGSLQSNRRGKRI